MLKILVDCFCTVSDFLKWPAECAVKDRIWGIGLSIKDKRRFDLKDIIETRATVRQTAKKFGISKSTVHTVVTK